MEHMEEFLAIVIEWSFSIRKAFLAFLVMIPLLIIRLSLLIIRRIEIIFRIKFMKHYFRLKVNKFNCIRFFLCNWLHALIYLVVFIIIVFNAIFVFFFLIILWKNGVVTQLFWRHCYWKYLVAFSSAMLNNRFTLLRILFINKFTLLCFKGRIFSWLIIIWEKTPDLFH